MYRISNDALLYYSSFANNFVTIVYHRSSRSFIIQFVIKFCFKSSNRLDYHLHTHSKPNCIKLASRVACENELVNVFYNEWRGLIPSRNSDIAITKTQFIFIWKYVTIWLFHLFSDRWRECLWISHTTAGLTSPLHGTIWAPLKQFWLQ